MGCFLDCHATLAGLVVAAPRVGCANASVGSFERPLHLRVELFVRRPGGPGMKVVHLRERFCSEGAAIVIDRSMVERQGRLATTSPSMPTAPARPRRTFRMMFFFPMTCSFSVQGGRTWPNPRGRSLSDLRELVSSGDTTWDSPTSCRSLPDRRSAFTIASTEDPRDSTRPANFFVVVEFRGISAAVSRRTLLARAPQPLVGSACRGCRGAR